MADGGHFEKMAAKKLVGAVRYLLNRWLDCFQIWCGGFLGISDDLIYFWEKIMKNKMDDGRQNSRP